MARSQSIDFAQSAVRSAAAGAFVLCFPMMLVDAVRRSHPLPGHQFQFVTAGEAGLAPGLSNEHPRAVVLSAWLDLVDHPLLLRLPDTEGRFFTLTLMDCMGEVFASYGARTGDSAGMTLALARPGWRGDLPRNVASCEAPTDRVWAVARLYAHSPADRSRAELLAKQLRISFSAGETPGEVGPEGCLPVAATSSTRQVASLKAATFLHRAEHLLGRAPPDDQGALRASLLALAEASGGLAPSFPLSPLFERAVDLGLADGMAAIVTAANRDGDPPFGWRSSATEPGAAEATPLERAVRAYLYLGSPAQEDLLRLTCEHDEAGRPLSAGERYLIRVARDAVPPARAFWCIGICPDAGGKAECRDETDLMFNEDGSVDLIIAQDRPDIACLGNWLQSPPRGFRLSCDLYWPGSAALKGEWRMPSVERLGSTPSPSPPRR